jgi:signal transduction histidine kinase
MDSAVRCIEIGAEDYLPKPFNPVLLRARLHASLQKKKLRDLEKAYLRQEVTLRQNEKLATLGKLSAGMAHELNNPAAAVQRGAGQLQAVFADMQRIHLRLADMGLTPLQVEALLDQDRLAQERVKNPLDREVSSGSAALARSDREVELETWLDARGVERAWEFAPALVGMGMTSSDLDDLGAGFTDDQLPTIIEWLYCTHTASTLIHEIGVGAGRITELVKALKSYAYLDQAPLQAVDIHQGLDDTLVILRSKLKQGISVCREYSPELPLVQAYGSELNQVWTNLIDNAIDAMGGVGVLRLRTYQRDNSVVVEIGDNGPGIPANVIGNVFEPFYTTKGPGKGTGLGLYVSYGIIKKHDGKITVESQPGDTRFIVSIPFRLEG